MQIVLRNIKNICVLVVIGISVLLLSGCIKKDTLYDKYVNELRNINESSDIDYDVNITYDYLYDGMVIYEIVIDNPRFSMYDISVLAIHNKETNDIYPSLGIFDESVSLVPDEINEVEGLAKGIVLIGYIPYNGDLENINIEFKIELSYKNENNEVIKTYYVTKL